MGKAGTFSDRGSNRITMMDAETSPEQRQQAARVVLRHVSDPAEAREVLEMLGCTIGGEPTW